MAPKIAQIDAPQASPPPAPSPLDPYTIPPEEVVRNLARMLHDDGRPYDVVFAVGNQQLHQGAARLDALEQAIIATLLNDRNRDQARELRRIIRFVRHGYPSPLSGTAFTASGGDIVKWKNRDKVPVASALASGGTVTSRTKARVQFGPVWMGRDPRAILPRDPYPHPRPRTRRRLAVKSGTNAMA
jgi:hypothetical protein